MQSPVIPAVVIRRVLSARPERVYQAWTTPQLATEFICPADVSVADVALDVRVGGTYHIAMRVSNGEIWTVRGVYREVVPNSRLSMTWKWDEDDPSQEQETLLTIDLAPHGTGTELTLTHEQFKSEESRNNHEEGWNSMLDKMETLR
ncbi:MAG TPA: SRPBCC domain-containing protein [Candidatus Baltobacteraceae bacterium]|nr:SRPBCC domain-containing protein [Candidatus Baltobacteraceae bacterium]